MNSQTAIRHEELKLRLYPCNFDDATADPTRDPKNLSEKGSAAETDTQANQQADLFSSGLPRLVPMAEVETFHGYTSLLLGMHFESEFPKAEVALPVRFMGGRFKTFLRRVPLLDGQPVSLAPVPKHDNNDVFGEVEIPIKVVS